MICEVVIYKVSKLSFGHRLCEIELMELFDGQLGRVSFEACDWHQEH